MMTSERLQKVLAFFAEDFECWPSPIRWVVHTDEDGDLVGELYPANITGPDGTVGVADSSLLIDTRPGLLKERTGESFDVESMWLTNDSLTLNCKDGSSTFSIVLRLCPPEDDAEPRGVLDSEGCFTEDDEGYVESSEDE